MARFEFPEWTESFKKWVLLLMAGGPVYLLALWAYGLRPEAIREARRGGTTPTGAPAASATVSQIGHMSPPPPEVRSRLIALLLANRSICTSSRPHAFDAHHGWN